jgi:ABC-type lipoprotein export system ATPase subunit
MSLKVNKVTKNFGNPPTKVLQNINFDIQKGEFVSLTGKSGSGKSTLLYILSSLDVPTSGNVLIDGKDLHAMDEISIHQFRNLQMGFVFQFHYLLPELTAFENALMPARKTFQEKSLEKKALDLLKNLTYLEKNIKNLLNFQVESNKECQSLEL